MNYETYIKIDNRYYFIGWYPVKDNDFLIKTKTIKKNNKTFLYNTYKYLNGDTETYKIIIG